MKKLRTDIKDSGIEWLGDVPDHWDILRIDSVTNHSRSQIAPDSIESDTVFHYSIPVVQKTGTGQYEPTDDLGSSKQVVEMRTVLVSKLNPRKSTICIAEPMDEITLCSTEFVALQAANCELKYLYYLMNSELNRQRLDSRVQSVTRSHQRVNPSDIYRFWIAIPPRGEQLSIAAFLDRETGRIDDLIRKKEQVIELLKEKRIALITQAVTKGLDPDAKMKDSGIEWMGEVPEHWEIQKLRRVCRFAYGDSLPDDDRNDEQVPVYGSNGIVGFHDMSNTLSPAIIIGRKGSYGKLNYSQDSAFAIDTTYYIDRKTTSHNIRWLFYMLTILRLDEGSKDSAVPGLAREDAYSLAVPVCDPDEQQAIASFLDRETGRIDELIQKNERVIELLKEYRASLIHHAVTGKINLRGYDDQLR